MSVKYKRLWRVVLSVVVMVCVAATLFVLPVGARAAVDNQVYIYKSAGYWPFLVGDSWTPYNFAAMGGLSITKKDVNLNMPIAGDTTIQWYIRFSLIDVFPNSVEWYYIDFKSLTSNATAFEIYIVHPSFTMALFPSYGADVEVMDDIAYKASYEFSPNTGGVASGYRMVEEEYSDRIGAKYNPSGLYVRGCDVIIRFQARTDISDPQAYFTDLTIYGGTGDKNAWIESQNRLDLGLDDYQNEIKDIIGGENGVNSAYVDLLFGLINTNSFSGYLVFGEFIDLAVEATGLRVVYVFSLAFGLIGVCIGLVSVIGKRIKSSPPNKRR